MAILESRHADLGIVDTVLDVQHGDTLYVVSFTQIKIQRIRPSLDVRLDRSLGTSSC